MSVDNRCREAARRLSAFEFVRIHSDDDADGIGAAAVITAALARKGIPFHLTLGRLMREDYRLLEAHDHVLLLDQGAGELDEVGKVSGDVVLLDHHQVRGRAPRTLHVNPNLEGESGTGNCCTSSLALLTSLHMDPVNIDLALVSLAGIVGDRQHVPRLEGTNAHLAQRAIQAGNLHARRGLPFEGDTPLREALAASVDPFLPGLSGSASRAAKFLQDLGLVPDASASALNDEQTRLLTSALVAHLLAKGVEVQAAEEVAGLRYWGRLAGRPIAAGHLAALLNATQRGGTPGLGVAAGHGDPDALAKAEGLVRSYEEGVLKGLLHLEHHPPRPLKGIQIFDAPSSELAGAHCGLGITYLFAKDKPAFALSVQGERLKVSGRATPRQVERGADLANALHHAASEFGGGGGGHPIAAGASVPSAERERFLARLDEIVAAQVHGET